MSAPEVIREIESLRRRLDLTRRLERTIALVPTMGALHAGHAELLRVAREKADFVVASIFVNPLQFDRREDLENYPRAFETDLHICEKQCTDVVFAPAASEFYPNEPLTFVESPALGQYLCGAFRPGHFRGVATVVLKLLNVVQPDYAAFGEKDAQQLAIIRRMVSDLNVPVEIVPVATVREPDGLALSSRNKHLNVKERMVAPVLYRALRAMASQLEDGERSAATLKKKAHRLLVGEGSVRVEYLEIVDPDTLVPLDEVGDRALLAGAIWLGSTRLIDNIGWAASAVSGEAERKSS